MTSVFSTVEKKFYSSHIPKTRLSFPSMIRRFSLSSLLAIALLALPSASVCADAGPEAGFQAAIRLLQEEKNAEAADLFVKEYTAGKDFPALFYNWGHAAYRLGKKGMAAGLWRRALYLDPDLSVAQQALDYVERELPKDGAAGNLSSWASFRLNVLERVS